MYYDVITRRSAPPHASLARLLLIIVLLTNALPAPRAGAAARPNTPTAPAISDTHVTDQPLAVRYALSSAAGQRDQQYHVQHTGATYSAVNPQQGTQAVFDPRTLQVKTGSDNWALDLAGWGRAELQTPPNTYTTSLVDNRMEFDYGALSAWYVNGPGGTQQGWTVQARPAGALSTPLTVALVQRGSLRGTLDADRRGLTLHDAAGADRLRYAGLMALDANNQQLPVWMELVGDTVNIRVDDRNAVYPIVIDPLIAGPTYDGPGVSSTFGRHAISANGRTLVIYHPYTAGNFARLLVYDLSNPSQVQATFVDPQISQQIAFIHFAVSGDGKTIAATDYAVDNTSGTKIALFKLNNGTWARNSATYDYTIAAGQNGGSSMALNHDGSTIAIGDVSQGKIYVVRSSGIAAISKGAQEYGSFASSVAISADGNTIITASGDSATGGEGIKIFKAPTWQQSGVIVSHPYWLGNVAMSADGRTIAARAASGRRVFVYSAASDGSFASTPATLTGNNFTLDDCFACYEMALSPNGNTIAVGQPAVSGGFSSTPSAGAVYLFYKPSGGWQNATESELAPLNPVDNDRTGRHISFSATSLIVSMPGYGDNGRLHVLNVPPRPVPAINAISPNQKFINSASFTLTVSGSNFVADSVVRWNDIAMATNFVNDTTLQVQVPASYLTIPTVVPITVVTDAPGGGTTSGVNFSISTPTPVLTDVEPYYGPPAGGTTITLTGFNLQTATSVTFGGQPAIIGTRTATTLMVTTPVGASGDVDIAITTPDGATTMPAGFTYASTPPPVNYRDVGAMRIWANSFTTQGNQTVATGRVSLGSASQNAKYYQVGNSASWSAIGAISISGAVSFFDGTAFANGEAMIDPTSGVASWQPGAQILIERYGTTSLVAAGPSIALNVLQPTVTVNTALLMALPENPVASARVRYTLARDGTTATAGPGTIALKLAGGTLSAAVQVTPTGLNATNAQLVMPNMNTLSLPGITITDNAGIQNLRVGGGGTFGIPDVALTSNVLSLTGLSANVALVSGKYELALNGNMAITNFPEGANPTLSLSGAKLAQGVLTGNVADAALTAAGNPLTLRSLTIQRYNQKYQLQAGSADLGLPTAWGTAGNRPSATLSKATLTASAPYLSFQNPGFSVGETLYQQGISSATNQIYFSSIGGSLSYNAATNAFVTPLSGSIGVKFGQSSDGGGIGNVQFSYANGNVSASSSGSLSMQIAGSPFATTGITYNGTSLTTPGISLQLPAKWGQEWVQIGSMEIGNTSVTIAGSALESVRFDIPKVKLGPLELSGLRGRLAHVGAPNSQIIIESLITFTKGKPSKDSRNTGGNANTASVAGTLVLRNGHVSGRIDQFAFEMNGFGFSARGMSFNDDMMHADSVTLKLRIKSGDAEGTLSGITIGGPDEFSVGGGRFRIRDIDIGKVSIKEIIAEFQRTPDGSFFVEASGKVKFPKFTIEASIKISYDAPSDSVTLNRVFLSFKGKIPTTAIALGTTGFYLTTVSGEFSLDEGTLTITLGVGGQHKLEVKEKSLLDIQGTVTLQIKPEFEMRSTAIAKVLGYQVGRVDLRINSRAFLLKGKIDAGIIHASLEITFGLDAENEFTFYGRVAADVVVPKGYLFNECFLTECISVPWSDWNAAQVDLEGGKFRRGDQKVWGARGMAEVLGYDLHVMAILSPDTEIIIGKRMYEYKPVRPQFSLLQRQAVLAKFGPNANLAASGDLYQITVGAPTGRLTIIEVLADANLAAPTELEVVGPSGAVFTKTLIATAPDNSARIYTVELTNPLSAIGGWTFTTQTDNSIQTSGSIPPPSFETATLCPNEADCVARGVATTLDVGRPIELAWSTTSTYTDGLTVEAYATNSEGQRFNISKQTNQTERTLSGAATWTPMLASGTYTVTLTVEDVTSGPQKTALAVVTFNDTTPPAAPANLEGQATPDLAALLTWNSTVVEPDVAGYEVTIDGGAPSVEDQRVAEYRASGLTPGSTYTFAVRAYDLSGNIGPESTVTVTLPTIGLTAAWPPRGAQRASVPEVGATFTRAVNQPTLRVVTATDQPVPGETQLLASATSPTETVTLGAEFVPTTKFSPGTYTATISAFDIVGQQTVAASWSFEVLGTSSTTSARATVRMATTWPAIQGRAANVGEVGAVFTGPITEPSLALTRADGQVVTGGITLVTTPQSSNLDEIIGVKLVLPAKLTPGIYTATVTGWDPAVQQPVAATWSFEVVTAGQPAQLLLHYLPFTAR
ncbi:MAG: IPT/TIG domain-containing protein [Roseiflexaceae bacterium]|nr:IPT/TIG domain-containing protein [Roseiflexaceae bacterium]